MDYYLIDQSTFHNGGMHNVQHSQAMLERGVFELGHFVFHYQSKKNGNWCKTHNVHHQNYYLQWRKRSKSLRHWLVSLVPWLPD